MPNEGPDCVASGKLMALPSPAVQDYRFSVKDLGSSVAQEFSQPAKIASKDKDNT
jgi:hypothetical protein